MKHRILVVGLAAVVIGAAGLMTRLEQGASIGVGRIAEHERLLSYWRSLDLTAQTLSAGPISAAWDAGLFLDVQTLNSVFDQLNGLTAKYGGQGALAGATVMVTGVRLKPRNGALDTELDLVASHSGFSLPLKATANVTYQGVAKAAPSAAPVLSLRIEPIEISSSKPRPDNTERSFLTTLLPDLLVLFADPHALEIRVQLPDQISIPLGFQKQQTVPVNGGDGSVSYTASMEQGTVEQHLAYPGLVFTKDGIWLTARIDDKQLPASDPKQAPATPADLKKAIAELETAVSAKLERVSPPSNGAELFIAKSSFLSLAEKLRTLEPSKRRVSFATTGQSGHLAGRRQSLGVLGNIGVQADLLDNNSGSGTVDFNFGQASWDDNGLKLPLTAVMNADAKVQLNIDVIASGVVRTSVGLVGQGSGSMSAAAKPVILDSGNQSIAAVQFADSCSSVRADIRTDGVLKTDFGWTKVPSVGGRISSPVGPLPPVLVLDRRPLFVRTPTRTIGSWSISPRYPAVVMNMRPNRFGSNPEGLDIGVSLETAPVILQGDGSDQDQQLAAAERSTREQVDNVAAASSEILKGAAAAGACPGSSEFALLLGDLEFGENNELVRLLVVLGKLPEAALDAVKRLPGEVSPEKIKGWIDNPEDSFKRGEVGRQLDHLQHETSPEKVQGWAEKPVDSFKRSTPGQILTNPVDALKKLF